jgi:DNA-binding Lrp family transcriptional regulator
MKTIMILGERASELLFDGLNARIVRELVFSEHAIADLSKKLGVPPLKTWRRVQKLLAVKVVEVVRVDRVQNLEKKVYRATATNFVPGQFLDLKPNDERLAKAFRTYLEIQRQSMSKMASYSDIPAGANPTDFAIYAAAKSLCQLYLDPDVKNRVLKLEREISEFEQSQRLPQVMNRPSDRP